MARFFAAMSTAAMSSMTPVRTAATSATAAFMFKVVCHFALGAATACSGVAAAGAAGAASSAGVDGDIHTGGVGEP